jgi:glucose/arabinose dehydrogenase
MRTLTLLALATIGCSSDGTDPIEEVPPDITNLQLQLDVVASGLSAPLHLTAPANDQRLFIVSKTGTIRIVQNGQLLATPFLDVTAKILSDGERGLLSLAFDPAYATNGFFFVYYTNRGGDIVIERYRVSADASRADANSAKLILMVPHPNFSNHNGGHALFGPDGMLYLGTGDGGSGGDPSNNAQNRTALLGKLLRIDPNRGDPYAIPADNPFVGQSGARGEVWAYGLRNPWRMAFDRAGGQLYIADVGQNQIEEVNAVAANAKPVNYGWRLMEGDRCYNPATNCDRTGLTLPTLVYTHAGGACSITGGIVYRGQAIPELRGHYFYGDYCARWVKSFRLANGQATDEKTWDLGIVGRILSFGEDAQGEMYLLTEDGRVARFAKRR